MSRRAGSRAGAIVLALTVVLALAGAAVAAGGLAPKLLTPNHKKVSPGRIKLVVDVPLTPAAHGVFIAISPKKHTKSGQLKVCSVLHRCDFVEAAHHHGHKWTYTAPADNFPGWWATTPGKYYWQVHYFTQGDTALYYSGIGSFTVK